MRVSSETRVLKCHTSALIELEIWVTYLGYWNAYKKTSGLFTCHSFDCLQSPDPHLRFIFKTFKLSDLKAFKLSLNSFSKIFTIEMAPKSKHTAVSSSSTAAAPTSAGGSPPHETPISGNKWLCHCWEHEELRILILKFKNFIWSWTVDAGLTCPHLIYKRDPRVNEQNADLMIFAFLFCQRDLYVYELDARLASSAFWDF